MTFPIRIGDTFDFMTHNSKSIDPLPAIRNLYSKEMSAVGKIV